MALLAEVPLGRAYRLRVDSLVELIDAFDGEAERLRRLVADELADRRGYQATQAIPAWMGRGA
jgi:hypothetical protein